MNTTAPWRITLLGALRAELGGSVVTRFRSQKAGGLLAYLALFPRRVHAREELADLFWPDADPEAGRTNLRSVLASLRRQLEPPGVEAGSLLVTRGHSDVSLNRLAFETDVALFEQALTAAPAAGDKERARLLSEAVSLYGGPLLPGRYEDWALTERDRLAGLYLGALRDLAHLYEQSGEWERALDFARRAVSTDSLSEEAHLDILRLLMASGQMAAAKRHYAEMKRSYNNELGIEPPAEAVAILTFLPPVSVPVRPAVAISSASLSIDSAPKSAPFPSPPLHLPLTLTRFFGRENEIHRIGEALSGDDAARLLTLTGPGGAGKTRLAVETARALAPRFLGGVWFVPLADLREPGRFFDVLASTLGLPRAPTVQPQEQVTVTLNQHGEFGSPLLVLDNFEQIVEEGSTLVRTLLANVPRLACLVTSRQRLLLDGEQEYALPPLATPDLVGSPERLLEFPSVQLFVSRAQSARPDFQITDRNAVAVAQLCRRLEGIPLALELAAAWAQTLSPSQMLERLARRFDLLVSRRRDAPGRHATLRATVEWSYQLLSDELKRFFAGLSVFQSGWTLEAAEAILGEPCALEFLAELQDRSLILRDEDGADPDAPRFRMLETLREFAAEQVLDNERGRLAQRHFDWCLRFAEEAEQHQRGPDQVRHLRRLEAERGNLRTALEYTLRSGDEERRRDGLRLAAALGWFWFRRSLHREGRAWLEAALTVDGAREARIRVLHALGFIINNQADYVAAFSCFREAQTLAEAIGNEAQAVYSLFGTGLIRVNFQEPGEDTAAAATRLLADAAERFAALGRLTGDRWQTAHDAYARSLAAVFRQDYSSAKSCVPEAIGLFHEVGDAWMTTNMFMVQGMVGHFAGDSELMASGYAGVIRLAQEADYGAGLFWGLHGMACVVALQGQGERAARLFGAAVRFAETLHMALPKAVRSLHDRDMTAARAQIGDACFETAWAEGRTLSLEAAIALALA